jgi:predicted HAD superfamily Cof-like phosphohydrolase
MASISNYKKVQQMYEKFDMHIPGDTPHFIDRETRAFRVKAMKEEIEELSMAYLTNDLPGIADALVDLVIFAMGTAVLHDLPWEHIFTRVMTANMLKVPGPGIKERGSGPDLLKPPGWKSPDIKSTLEWHGWKS